jgi:hypothetical protein
VQIESIQIYYINTMSAYNATISTLSLQNTKNTN